MTNGVWWRSAAELKRRLSRLKAAGYDGDICVSVDAFHSQDLKKVAVFIDEAVRIWRRGDVVSIACVRGAEDEASRKKILKIADILGARLYRSRGGKSYIKSGPLFIKILDIELSPVGRARRLKDPWDGKWFREDYCEGPGNVFFVKPDGKVKPCCGYAESSPRLTIGDIRRDSASDIMKNIKNNKLVSTIFTKGLSRVRADMERRGIRFPGKTSNNCYFCGYILKRAAIFAGIAAVLFFATDLRSEEALSFLHKAKSYKGLKTRVVERIKLPSWYHEGIMIDGTDIWVSNGKKGKTWVVDAKSNKVRAEIDSIDGFTEGVAHPAGGAYFVTEWYSKKIYKASMRDGRLVPEASLSVAPAFPAGIVVVGGELYTIIWIRGVLGTRYFIIKTDQDLKETGRIRVDIIQEPAHMAWDGKFLWITSWYNDKVFKVDKDSLEILGSFRSPAKKATGIASDGEYLWITGTYADLYKVKVE
jgi:glutamine cyclotransferase